MSATLPHPPNMLFQRSIYELCDNFFYAFYCYILGNILSFLWSGQQLYVVSIAHSIPFAVENSTEWCPYFSTNLCALSNQPNFGNSFEFLDNRQLVASIREKVETHFDLCFLLDYSIFSVIMVIQHFIATSKQQSVTKAWDFFVKCSAKKICVENCGLVYIEGECTHSPKVIRYMIEIRLFRFLSSDLNIEFSRGGRPRNVASRSQISTLSQWASVSLEATDIVLEQEQILFAIT